MIVKKIYPYADIDYPDFTLNSPTKKKYKSVKFGNNVLIGKNVKIGKNSQIGANTVIEQNVQVGKDCIIGLIMLLKMLIGDKVVIQDSCKIGQKGFGFIPLKKQNLNFILEK